MAEFGSPLAVGLDDEDLSAAIIAGFHVLPLGTLHKHSGQA